MEGMMSLLILSMTAIAVYGTVVIAQSYTTKAKRVTQATNFARMKLEKVMDTDFYDIQYKYSAGSTYDANPYDSNYLTTDPDGDYAGSSKSSLPNGEWQVQYSGTDPLTIRLIVLWKNSGENAKQYSIALSSRVTAGRM